MPDVISSEELNRLDLPDWREVAGRIEATFHAGSFERAAAFIGRIASAAEAAQHHPDVDLRYPDRVHVTLVTHSAGGVTAADLSLARTISAVAREGAFGADPLTANRVEIGIDALDIDAVRPFWRAVLGYVEVKAEPGQPVTALVDPNGVGPGVWFQQMDAPRPQRNRMHFDVIVPHDVAEQRVAAAIAAGGRLVSDAHARAWWVLADAEGNEACICTWQDRG